jgi:AcrR family transcriptional regulator
MSDRLTKSEWLNEGLRALAEGGLDPLKVGGLAARLNVSRGSFYWHFQSVADYRTQLLQAWVERSTEDIIRRVENASPETDQLRALIHGAFLLVPALRTRSPWAAERAIRLWAANDAAVAELVASVDRRRMGYIKKLLRERGVDEQRAGSRAGLVYSAYLGQALVLGRDYASMDSAVVDDIVAIFSAG